MSDAHTADVQRVARNLLLGAMPEREAEFAVLWAAYQTEFQIVDDNHDDGPIVLDAGLYRFVRFNHRVMRLFWLAGYAYWEGYEAFHRFANGDPIRLEQFKAIVECFDQVMTATDVESVPWPDPIPPPGTLVDHVEGRAERVAGELAIFSTAFAVLHELRHIVHQNEGTSAPYDDWPRCREEEHSCDEFAAAYLLERIGDYASQSGEDAHKVRAKRQAGVYAALFALSLLSKRNPGRSNHHPAVQERLNRVIRQMSDRDGLDPKAWAGAAAAFCALDFLGFDGAATPLRSQTFVAKILQWGEDGIAFPGVGVPARQDQMDAPS